MTHKREGRRIYLAGRYRRREELACYGDELQADGHEVTSRWVYARDHSPDGHASPPEIRLRYAQEDYADLREADTVIAFTEEENTPYSHGGRHVELGMAIALKKSVFVVGPRENVFCHLPTVRHHDAWNKGLRKELRNERDDSDG